ncbi:hypothetical protein Gobs_2918 [Geodermatophilus obscurus DSM 43160]|uniref:Uncharacterized protein n=1 Tax=Geodermatophilus obscurus (strain ATCC 25078 / DSM 43160 / JCM 3152 / CCUG 61914 / KCC A-0152 / KCTC 9177 / NBRC 13315 / NRRL B-3577 / G-20) TaxID=526225 RepID=D2S7S7_GEOOG|nr:hypothetical protein Gobs_2918 [Geodermatophilus obscurus DSM 43160]
MDDTPGAEESYSDQYGNALRTVAHRAGRRRTSEASDLH